MLVCVIHPQKKKKKMLACLHIFPFLKRRLFFNVA